MTDSNSGPRTATGWATIGLALLLAISGLAELAGPLRGLDGAAPGGGTDLARAGVGLLELAGAILLLIPATFGYAVGLLGVALAGAGLLHLRSGPTWAAALPVVLLGLTLAVGAVRGRRSRTLARLHSALDAFADRELARRTPRTVALRGRRHRGGSAEAQSHAR
jgi:hypothetical protein